MYEIKISFSPELEALLQKLVRLLEGNPSPNITPPTTATTPTMPKLAYNTKEAAEQLGIHQNTLWGLLRGKQLKAVRVGRRWVIPAKSLEDFIAKSGTGDMD